MKLIVLFFFFVIQITLLLAHDQEIKPVHQRIIEEAYKLLKIQFSKEENGFADMDQYIGDASIQNIKPWYNVTTVAGGSEHEDREDIIWHYKGWNTSSTHFWDADHMGGDMKLYEWSWFPSAYVKACKYIWDDYVKEFIFPLEGGGGYKILYVLQMHRQVSQTLSDTE